MEGATASEKLDVFGKILGYFAVIGPNTKIPDDQRELQRQVHKFVTLTPGHAFEMERRIRRALAIERGNLQDDGPRTRSLWEGQIISELPSLETVKVLSGFLPEMEEGPDHSRSDFGLASAHILSKILNDSPEGYGKGKHRDVWLQWKKDIEEGNLTFRIKGMEGDFNFEGPAPKMAMGRDGVGSMFKRNSSDDSLVDEKASRSSGSMWIYVLLGVVILGGGIVILRQKYRE